MFKKKDYVTFTISGDQVLVKSSIANSENFSQLLLEICQVAQTPEFFIQEILKNNSSKKVDEVADILELTEVVDPVIVKPSEYP
jgi:hypothetical protein